MRDNNAVFRMCNSFIEYHTLFRKHGVRWVTDEIHKVAVLDVKSVIYPETLLKRLQSKISLGFKPLKRAYKAFMDHCEKLSEDFQIFYVGKIPGKMPSTHTDKKTDGHSTTSVPKKEKEKTRK